MDIENEELTFGRYLSSIRLSKGISIEEVEARTNIVKSLLLILEQEEYDKFPEPVYVIGFLRAYASVVGADGDEVIRRYRLGTRGFDARVKSETEYLNAGKGFWPRLILTLIVVLAVVGASIYFMNGADRPEESSVVLETKAREEPPLPAPEPSTRPAAAEPEKAGETEKIQVMKVLCVEDTWMKVITDGKKPVEYELKEGDAMILHGEKKFNLLIGNGRAVKVRLNGKPVTISGKNGQAVNLELP